MDIESDITLGRLYSLPEMPWLAMIKPVCPNLSQCKLDFDVVDGKDSLVSGY